ncbi:replication endonuclease [Paraburkholderia sp. CNPSo 3076]|uniref:replication endonuclease n=1 Tax=Paraburkholderia sp. CNPSo 3076 TaxID=2940936 RepID=UPI002250107D|nr:replication endonuclease [Paraburkholderia sp. CNPSo 3076]MCX5545682.1 replication endonuclease [Paraburkholderia sp. CNPSo 3076]
MKRLSSDSEWAASVVAGIPRPWAARLLSRWEKRRGSFDPLVTAGEGIARRKANEELRASVASLRPVSDALPLDASDNDVCNHAWEMAERCRVKRLGIEAEQQHAPTEDFIECVRAAGAAVDSPSLDTYEQRLRLVPVCRAAGIAPPDASRYEDRPAVMRMVAAHWWRGQLRKAHAKAVERAAIGLSLVAKDRECYVSSWSLEARRYQNERNAATLENTIAKNLETEQEFTLAQLAAKGTANKAIRRTELMTRINGFERIAIAAGHAGLFLTITCPSKMHRRKVQGARTVDNGNWDGTTPDEAQAYLRDVWARIRAALARRGVNLYGFRIAEPQHDGTPHWHCLFFYEAQHADTVRTIVRRYALAMDGDEPGAQAKRCDFKRMDPAKGTAAGYIAKYVAKNIDGYRLEKDLEGNDSLETSARVEAWASRWRIRQFQQIGGPPVSVWRELRRVEAVPDDAPPFVRDAHNAVNKVAVFEGRDNASVAWDRYVKAQGGVSCGRNYRVRIAKVQGGGLNRYGEEGAAQIVGIEYADQYRKVDGIATYWRARTVTVESKRYEWVILRPAAHARAGYAAQPVEGFDLGFKREHRAPWTCVNNCTVGVKSGCGSEAARGGEGCGYSDPASGGRIQATPRDGQTAGQGVFRGASHGNAVCAAGGAGSGHLKH